MNYKLLLLWTASIATVWASPSLAARQSVAGGGTTALDNNGSVNGVDMTASAGTGTLTVGTLGGAQTDIFSSNNPLGTVAGIAISTDASSTANVTFNSSSTIYGDIGITNPGGPFFLNINAGSFGSTVNFLGSVYGTTLDLTDTGIVNFNSGSTNITATNFAGDGTISLAPNTTLVGALTTNTANTGTLNLGGGSRLTGAVGGANGLKAINVVGGSNLAGVSATIDGAADVYSLSLGTNTLNVTGALNINNPGPNSINTTLASPTIYGHIIPVGFTTLPASLGINVLVPSTSYIPVGTQFNIVQATSGSTGSIVAVTVQNPTNPLYTFSAVPLAGTLDGLVTIQTDSTPIQVAANPVVPVLLGVTPSADLTEVLTAINAFSDPAAVNGAVTQLSPSTSTLAAPLVTFQGTTQFQNLWASRLDSVLCRADSKRDDKNPTCHGNDTRSGWWMNGFGYSGKQDAQQNSTGYNSRIFGTMIAYDVPVAPDTRAGIGLGYARSTINGKTYDTDTDSNTYQATAYIGHESGPWFVHGDVALGLNDYNGTRHIQFTGVDRSAKADYNGHDYTAFVSSGYHFAAQEFKITPLASLQYTRMQLSGYNEKGAGDIDLQVQSQTYDFLESGLGVKIDRDFKYRDGVYVPEVHTKWLHELSNPTLAQKAAFAASGSSSFTTQGLKTADDTYNVGMGLTLLSCACSAKTWSVEAVYDYDWRQNGYSAHQGMLKLSSRF